MISLRPLLPVPLLLTLSFLQAYSQPHTYILPDIGTPGMNTYVEVIATVDSVGKFTIADGLAAPSTLSVRFLNPADSMRVRVSPGLVSWDGRLLSFQFFVKPGAALGPVPIEIAVNNQGFAVDTFHIVAVQPFGTKTGGGVIGSGPGWGGTRSRRGAIIVDSMVLNSGVYTIDTTDRDPATAGNQGFLPAIILSRGRIVVNTGAVISASGRGKNAGPGGGGGGGYGRSKTTFPSFPGELDAPQGSGFSGGRSNLPPLVASPGPFGNGTGLNSASINNVSASTSFSTSRLFGSGSGHPFDRDGRSGGAAAVGGTPTSFGIYFGAGGNATAGSGLPGAAPSGVNGQIIGNAPIAPLAGGSGGSSGGSYDSTGGGGGGALALYSERQTVIAVAEARGADGRNGGPTSPATLGASGDPSAGGAGGSILIGGKLGVMISTVNVGGGIAGVRNPAATQGSFAGIGGVGRYRNDGRNSGTPNVTLLASRYTGPTIDTLTFADTATWTVRGTGRYRTIGGGDSIFIYVRGENSPWGYPTTFRTRVNADSTWSVRIAFPFDTLAYIMAIQKADTSGGTEFTRIPAYIYSQAAASIVRLSLVPRIVGPNSRSFDTVKCAGTTFDTLKLANRGTGLLIVRPGSTFIGANGSLYRIVSPTLPDTTLPGDTLFLVVGFNGGAAANGDRSTTLRLLTNDESFPQYDVSYRTWREARDYRLSARVINMGGVQMKTTRDTVVVYRNNNNYPHVIEGVSQVAGSATFIRVTPMAPVTVNGGDSAMILFRFLPTDTSRFTAKFIVLSNPCGEVDTIYFEGYGTTGVIDSRKSLTFGELACADTAYDSVWVKNVGNATLTVHYPTITGLNPASFAIVAPPNVGFPRQIAVGDSLNFRVRVIGGGAGAVLAQLRFENSDSLYQKNPHYIDLNADRDDAVLSTDTLVDFGTICVGQPYTGYIRLNNASNRTTIAIVGVGHSDSTGPLVITDPILFPTQISAGAFSLISVRIVPPSKGVYYDTIFAYSQPCNKVLPIYVRYTAVDASLTSTPDPIAFGDVQVGTTSQQTVIVTNTAPVDGGSITIQKLQLLPGDPALRIIYPTLPPSRTLAPGDTIHVLVEYAPTVERLLTGQTLCAIISSPCPDTTCWDVTGQGIRSAVGVSRNKLVMAVPACIQAAPIEDTVTVFNSGTATVNVSSIVVAPAQFTLVSPAPPITLAPGARRAVRVRFTPGVPGTVNGTLTFTTNDVNRPSFKVDLVGRRDTLSTEPSTRSIDFGPILSCQGAIIRRLTLHNRGTAIDTIVTVNTDPPTAFSIADLPPYYIGPSDSTVIRIRFNPTSDGQFQSKLIYIANCGRPDSVLLTGERLTPSQNIGTLDFGDVTQGSTGNAMAIVTNNNPMPIRISGARIVPGSPEYTINPAQFPMIIAGAGGAANINVSFAPASLGDIPAGTQIVVDMDSVCVLTFGNDVTGRAIEGGVAANRSRMSFGDLLFCRTTDDTVTIRNIGTNPVEVSSLVIDPPASVAFYSIVGGTLAAPQTLQPTDSGTVIVRFTPVAGADGARIGTLRVTTDDPIRPVVDVALDGARVSQSVAIMGPTFGIVGTGTTSTVTQWLVNTGTAPIVVTQLVVPAPFQIVASRPTPPVTLAPGDSIEVDIEFAPITPGDYSEMMAVSANNGCDSLSVMLNATAQDLTVIDVGVRFGSVAGRPGDVVRIPLVIDADPSSVPITGFTATARFNPTLLYPIGVVLDGTLAAGWTVTSQNRRAGSFAFSTSGTSPLAGTGTIAFIEAKVLLGDAVSTPIAPGDTSFFDNERARMVLDTGIFTLEGVCVVGGGRLIRVDGIAGIKSVRPNPVSGRADIAFEIVETGHSSLVLYDALGNEAIRLVDGELEPRLYVVSLSSGMLPSGIYYLELRTPTESHRVAVVVVE